MTPQFRSAMMRRMSAAYLDGSPTQLRVWRALPEAGARFLLEQSATWPFEIDEIDRDALAERFAQAMMNDEISDRRDDR